MDNVERVVLVTGATRGIGAGIAGELLARGRWVACGYHTSRGAAEKIGTGAPERALPVHVDLRDPAGAHDAVRTVTDRWRRLDALILNAGVWAGGRLTRMEPDAWWDVLEANVRGTAALVRAALPDLVRGTDPSVVIVSSVVGLIGYPGDTAYGAAKAAQIGFARSLAKEVAGSGVRVNVCAPGFVDTDMTSQVPAESRAAIEKATLLGRFGRVEEIAKAAVFLSEDATFCTGTVLCVDGGWSI